MTDDDDRRSLVPHVSPHNSDEDPLLQGIPDAQRERIERGEAALNAMKRGETFERWLDVAQACQDFQQIVMRQADVNQPTGARYREMWQRLAAHFPLIAGLHKSERSHALWVLERREELILWLKTKPANLMYRLNHPRTIRNRWKKEHVVTPPEDKEGTARTTKQITLGKFLELQAKLDAFEGKGKGHSLIPHNAKAEDVADILSGDHDAAWMRRLAQAAEKQAAELARFEATTAKRKRRPK